VCIRDRHWTGATPISKPQAVEEGDGTTETKRADPSLDPAS